MPEPEGPVTRISPFASSGQPAQNRREAQLLEVEGVGGNPAHDQADRSPLTEGGDPEAAQFGAAKSEVGITSLLELLDRPLGEDGLRNRLGVIRAQAGDSVQAAKLTRNPHHRRRSDLEMQVGRARRHGPLQQLFDRQYPR